MPTPIRLARLFVKYLLPYTSFRLVWDMSNTKQSPIKKAIFYKNYLGQWTKDTAKPTAKRFAWIKKHKAENGVATIQSI